MDPLTPRMDPQQMMASIPNFYYPPAAGAVYGQFPGPMGSWDPISAQMMGAPFPATPISSGMHMLPDTTVKSGSEFSDTPPSSGSSSNQTKRRFKTTEEEKRYRQKRTRNNEAAKKSRKSRKEKEVSLQHENGQLKEQLRLAASSISELHQKNHSLQQENANLKARIVELESMNPQFNRENINPAQFTHETKPFTGMMYSLNMNPQ